MQIPTRSGRAARARSAPSSANVRPMTWPAPAVFIVRTFAELGALCARAARPERIGICIDTCHLFAAGYDVRHAPGYRQAIGECGEAVGFARVLAFHLNDAKAPLGSGLDRHEHIGRGHLGLAPFARLLTDRRFRRVPKVLETPKEPEPAADRRNLALLRSLRRR